MTDTRNKCEQCGDGLMTWARSERYKTSEGERRIRLEFDCDNCGYVEVIDAKVADRAQACAPDDGGEGD